MGSSAPLALGLGGRAGDALDSGMEAALAGLVIIVVAEAAKLALVTTVTSTAQYDEQVKFFHDNGSTNCETPRRGYIGSLES